MSEHPARQLWKRLESIHAVTYFSPEPSAAHAGVGLRGFWMGYFATRAAPLGPVSAGTVEAAFFNFAPWKVRKAIPDAWTFAAPDDILSARAAGAAAALRRLSPEIEAVAMNVSSTLEAIVDTADDAGRVLFGANRDVGLGADSVENLWSLATCLREHRGDGHVALLTSAGLDGCEAHVVAATEVGHPPELFLESRGWTEDEWSDATTRLTERGLVAGNALTAAGQTLRGSIEATTDDLAFAPMRAFDVDELCRDLDAVARAVVSAGEIRFPNPMGLPRLEPDEEP